MLAIAAHPDDIEFMMAGTLILLADEGWQVHCLNLSSGNLGSMNLPPAKTAQVRRKEAQNAARSINATWHPSICNDLQIFYDDRTLRRVAAIVRETDPSIVLTHSPDDYMCIVTFRLRDLLSPKSYPPRGPTSTGPGRAAGHSNWRIGELVSW